MGGRSAQAMIRRLSGQPRDVWLIGLISLVNDGASDLIYPLLAADRRGQPHLWL